MDKKYKAVIIDDEKLAQDIIINYIKKHENIEVIATCSNGFEGIKVITEQKPDIIFLDIQMPKINGFEMLELLDEVPVIIFKGKVYAKNHNELPNIDAKKHKQFLKKVHADKNGFYVVDLEPGEYTIVAEIEGKLYLNSFQGGNKEKGTCWSTVTVEPDGWVVWNIKDTSDAAF